MSNKGIKSQVQARYSQHADAYVQSVTHAKHHDLDQLVEMAQPQSHWRILDIATGGGHTALKFAPHVASVIVTDLTFEMLKAAKNHILTQAVNNTQYAQIDGEKLAFANGTFDLITCRIAPHHFPDVFRFVQECVRVLKMGGKLLIQDHVLPDDEKAARYVDSFERLRDPSHVRAFAAYEWEGMYLDAGLQIVATNFVNKTHNLITWAQRQGCEEDTIQRLQVMLKQAPQSVYDWVNPKSIGTSDTTFENRHILILGQKG